MNRRQLVRLPALTLLLLASPALLAQEKPKAPPKKGRAQDQFIRVVRDKKDTPTALEAAIVRYGPLDGKRPGPTVDLVAAVHVADKSFYQQLNKEFAGYDAVLYELVAKEGTRIPKGAKGGTGSPLSAIQKGITEVLSLEFQLEAIDYTRANMVHADMSPEQFAKSMRDRNESVWTMFFRMMRYALARQNSGEAKISDVDLLMALLNKNRAMALKRVLAEEMEDMEGSLLALSGPDGSTLVEGRNQVALAVLKKQVAAGKKKVAIFYGAAHMPDFAERLKADFALGPKSTRWLTAWDLKDESPKDKKEQGRTLTSR